MIKSLSLPGFFNLVTTSKIAPTSKRRPVSSGPMARRKAAGLLLVAANVFLLLSYLTAVNSYASTGFEIKTLQNRLSAETLENKSMSVKYAEASSVNMQNDFVSANFVSAGTPQFLQDNQFSQR
jgi:hypothetical protein